MQSSDFEVWDCADLGLAIAGTAVREFAQVNLNVNEARLVDSWLRARMHFDFGDEKASGSARTAIRAAAEIRRPGWN